MYQMWLYILNFIYRVYIYITNMRYYKLLACKHNEVTNLNHIKLARILDMCSVALFRFTCFEPTLRNAPMTVASLGAIIYYIVTSHEIPASVQYEVHKYFMIATRNLFGGLNLYDWSGKRMCCEKVVNAAIC